MKIQQRKGSPEKLILIGMITNPIVLGRIAARWEPDLFASRWANLIGNWAVRHFKQYGKPPGKQIGQIFNHWANAKSRDDETVELVERFLQTLSKEYEAQKEDQNPQYVIDLAGRHFNLVKAKRFGDQFQNDLENDDLDSALEKHHKFQRVEMGVGAGVTAYNDKEVFKGMFEDKRKPIIKYPGSLGFFFHDALEMDSFVSIQAPEKRGKSFVLQDMAFRAVKQGHKTGYIEAGDMTLNQVMRRFITRAVKRPLKATRHAFKYPLSIEHDPDKPHADVEYDTREYKNDLDIEEAWEITQKTLGENNELLRLSCHKNSTINVNGIVSILQGWEHEGFRPTVLIIDYMDILAPLYNKTESREQINDSWKAVRSLSQDHYLIITATQAKASSYNAHTQDQSHYSDDKRKHSHVTAQFAINQTPDEKSKGISRWNWVDLRDSEFDTSKQVYVAECRSISNIAVKSCF